MSFSSPQYICQHTFLSRLDHNSVVFDFGANYGKFSHEILKRFGSRVFGAEPVPVLANGIATDPRLTILQVAVGGEKGTLVINVFDNRCASMYGKIDQAESSGAIDAECVTLAQFRARAEVSHIDLLKVDIEGAELSLFELTPDEEFRNIDQITVEFHDFIYPELYPRVEAVKNLMAKRGFWVMPFSHDNTDVLFVNKRLAISLPYRIWLMGPVKYGRGFGRMARRFFGLGEKKR